MESGFLHIVSSDICFTVIAVSILVLMESGFLLFSFLKIVVAFNSFYPCFNGIRVLTDKSFSELAESLNVSILVLMESGFLLALLVDVASNRLKFLSLF